MAQINPYAVMVNLRRVEYNREKERTSEVARIANDLQVQGMTRTEALRVAEKLVPY